ncbi:CHAT domain-containing protein [Catellatospora chokoriensis]|nr:CHAT domain-containing protein [Catellatospora chokoriensis]
MTDSTGTMPQMMPEQHDDAPLTDHRMALAREWDDLVEQVRALEGFEDFLRPPPLENLLPAATNGPVVIVNVSQRRCDALILSADEMTTRELPDLTAADAAAWTNRYLNTLRDVERAAERPALAGPDDPMALTQARQHLAKTRRAAEVMLRELLAWLWRAITEPVLVQLGILGPPTGGAAWPRLWWCPTGPLTLLPLHAAGHHDTDDGQHRTVIDRVVSSYTPTVRALVEARKPHAEELARADSLLVVSQGDAPGQPRLPGVDREVAMIESLIPAARRTVLAGAAATLAAVQEELTQHRWVHFSCHGTQDLADPSEGGLLLRDGILTIADITSRQYFAEFACLSACKTATGGVSLLDEAITLAAALHYAGYRHVIGTLWSVYDSAATDLFQTVYTAMAVDGRLHPQRSAIALHQATRALRDTNRTRPSAWIPFTHTGP